jgi:hypothetical protein
MNKRDAKALTRVRYHSGQKLSASDLQLSSDRQASLRALHMRALHNTWGIALDFQVSLENDNSELLVQPGLAYDGFGQELILTSQKSFNLSGRNSESQTVLVVSKADIDAKFESALNFCEQEELHYDLEFSWREKNQVRLGRDIPLAELTFDGNEVFLDVGLRRYAKPMRRPKIESGTLKLSWDQWEPKIIENETVALKLKQPVDTSIAGFSTELPYYFAQIVDTTYQEGEATKQVFDLGKDGFIVPLLIIDFMEKTSTYFQTNRIGVGELPAERQHQFQISIYFLHQSKTFEEIYQIIRNRGPIQIAWTGIELNQGCSPSMRKNQVQLSMSYWHLVAQLQTKPETVAYLHRHAKDSLLPIRNQTAVGHTATSLNVEIKEGD